MRADRRAVPEKEKEGAMVRTQNVLDNQGFEWVAKRRVAHRNTNNRDQEIAGKCE
jgi:hypothetical protein